MNTDNHLNDATSVQYMIPVLEKLAPLEGYNLTSIPSVRILRSNRPLTRTPVLYDPGIVIVCQGSKRGRFGDEIYLYDAQQYLAVAVPVPFTMETDASPECPLLAIYMHLDFQIAADLMLRINQLGQSKTEEAPKSMMSSPMDEHMRSSVNRLLDALSKSPDDEILGPALVREIYFRVLTGPQGGVLRSSLSMRDNLGKIGKAIQLIHRAYSEPLQISRLVKEAGMSIPAFHNHFKAVTQATPIQYLKSVRLHQARLLMVRQGLKAATACLEVGYESPSQFNRDFKRLFNRTPAQEARYLRETFSLPPPESTAIYISSH
jgi:AraC-like DNA-binding protein